tara:strand:- start:76 stop:282 length:207 start_codon:yes stop_codon:yes gene_type:complete
MKLIKVRVNRTVEYEASVAVDNNYKYEQIRDYLQTIDWRESTTMKPLADYYDWIDCDGYSWEEVQDND